MPASETLQQISIIIYRAILEARCEVLSLYFLKRSIVWICQGCGTPDCSSVLRILVPDELHGSLNTRTLPVRPNMNTREICRILAHKIRCTNPQDYGLFKLVQGEGKNFILFELYNFYNLEEIICNLQEVLLFYQHICTNSLIFF